MINTVVYYVLLVLTVFTLTWLVSWLTIFNQLSVILPLVALFYLSVNLSNWLWVKLTGIPKELVEPGNKAVFITGCDTGFGHKLAQRLAKYGFFVYAGCLQPEGPGAGNLRKTCGKNVRIIKLDVTKEDEVKSAAKEVQDNLRGRQLWTVVNNAGILISSEIEMGDMVSFTRQMDINCMGTIRVTKAFLPLLRSSRGRIVNVGSLAGRYCIPGMVAYSMSKAAVISFSEGLRREMKKWSIDVITIEPHLFKTNLCNDETQKRQLQAAWAATPDSVKCDYGECYLEGYQKFLDKILDSARPQVDNVVETMMIAVTHKFVGPSYRVMGDLERVRVQLYDFLPVRLFDLISHHLSQLYTGKPALIKALYEKKKQI